MSNTIPLQGTRKKLVDNTIQLTCDAGGDGWSVIACVYVDTKEVADYVQQQTKWVVDETEWGYIIHDSQEAIAVMSLDAYTKQFDKYKERFWDEVHIII